MPMIDIHAPQGMFHDPHALVQEAARLLMQAEGVPDLPMFRENTAAFLHEFPPGHMSNVDGDGRHVRIQVLTNAGALDRARQALVVETLTALAARASGDPAVGQRTWVLLTEAVEGGWGLWGRAHTNADLVAAARAEIAARAAKGG